MSRHHHERNGKGFAMGALFGGLVGGITALLFAPKAGNKTRKELKKKCHDITCQSQDLFNDVCDQTTELVERAKDIAYTAKEAASKIYKD